MYNQNIDFNALAEVLIGTLKMLDFLWVLLSALLMYRLMYGSFDLPTNYAIIVPVFSLFTVQWYKSAGIYLFNPNRPLLIRIKNVSIIWFKVNLVLVTVIFFGNLGHEIPESWLISTISLGELGYGTSRLWVVNWFCFGLLGFILLRVVFYLIEQHYYQQDKMTIRAVIIGAQHTGRWVIQHFKQKKEKLIKVIGIYDDRVNFERVSIRPMNLQTITIKGGINDLINFMRENPVDMVIVTLPYEEEDRIHQVVTRLRVLPVEIHVCPGRISYDLDKSEVVDLGGIPMLKIVGRPLEKGGWLIKQIEDILVAIVVVLLTAPLMLLIMLAIKLESRGPAFYVQQRGGFNSATFGMYKFRTMRYKPGAPVVQAQPRDPRVTRVGRFLRKHSLDELPQFFNVLKGDMSVIGPRPHAIEHDREFNAIIAQYISRLRVKPGITGWAQVNGFRGLTNTREKLVKRLEYDLYYIDNWSIWLDLRIILKTVLITLSDKNAF